MKYYKKAKKILFKKKSKGKNSPEKIAESLIRQSRREKKNIKNEVLCDLM